MINDEYSCICTEWDGRGLSCCGMECPKHPLNGYCPGSEAIDASCPDEARTHNSVKCAICADLDGEYV